MSRSLRRANARVRLSKQAALAAATCQTERAISQIAAGGLEHRRSLLRAAFEKESIQQQQNHGADDRHDPAGDVILAREDA